MSYTPYTTSLHRAKFRRFHMKPLVYSFGLIGSLALVSFFTWPILLACAALSLATLVFSLSTTEAAELHLTSDLDCQEDLDARELAYAE